MGTNFISHGLLRFSSASSSDSQAGQEVCDIGSWVGSAVGSAVGLAVGWWLRERVKEGGHLSFHVVEFHSLEKGFFDRKNDIIDYTNVLAACEHDQLIAGKR